MNIGPLLERHHARAADYRMITSLSLKNFRCFDQISLTDLKRVTVITGASAVLWSKCTQVSALTLPD